MIRSAGRPLLGACGMSVLLNAISAPGTLAVSHTVLACGRLRREQMDMVHLDSAADGCVLQELLALHISTLLDKDNH